MSGEDVLELQKRFIAEGYLKIAAPTRFFGAMTEAALKAYQRANKLEAVGFTGPKTRTLLNQGAATAAPKDNAGLIETLRAQVLVLMAKLEELKAKQVTP